jgi:aminoglycoside phosphotransferase (APT) family kinase protein
MSMSRYVWTVARTLRTQVYDTAPAGAPRDALENSIRVLTAVANALEARAPVAVAGPHSNTDALQRADCDRLPGPAENTGAYGDTADSLAVVAAQLDQSSDGSALASDDVRAQVAWEKSLIDAAVERMDAVERIAGTAAAAADSHIDPAALERYLRARLGAPGLEIGNFRAVLGGRSRQTALFTVANAPGIPQSLVIQRSLPGMKAGPAFNSERGQYVLLKALHTAGLKVPQPLLVEDDSGPIGAPFIILERLPGTPAEPDYWKPVQPESVALDLARQMAALHAQPIDEIGPMLPQSRERYDREGWISELSKLADEWHRLAHWPSVTMSAVIAWLRANVDCVEDRRSFVHNDMVFHNILAEDGRITAILDWEQTSIGHPGEDLGYCFPVVSAATDWARFMEIYVASGGPRLSQRQIDYFALRAGLRLMTLVLKGGRDVFESGQAEGILVASAGAFFSQRLLHRIAAVLESVLTRA